MNTVTIIGGGLAGSEAAWQVAERGLRARLFEMRPAESTGAHQTEHLAELVCSNSLGSDIPDRASGVLKSELRRLGCFLMKCADETAVPAGGALAVDRDGFAELVSRRLSDHPNIEIVREEAVTIPDGPAIVASGPLTSPALSDTIAKLSGEEHLFFFDAIAPVVSAESINMDVAFRASRYGRGEQEEGDYINCPFTREEYEAFIDALLTAERIPLHSFEKVMESGVRAGMHHFFEGCLPIEILAQRGRDALAYGPMRPVGLTDPRTGRRPHAALQLRQDNIAASMYNLVGFQTNLKFPEQKRVFSLIPGLDSADFIKYGQMHRNTFIAAPKLLRPSLQWHDRDDLFFAGQLTGVEGYAGNIATGLLAGINLYRILNDEEPMVLPEITMLGALCHYVTHADMKDFQPMKANFGIFPPLVNPPKGKRPRAEAYAERAKLALEEMLKKET